MPIMTAELRDARALVESNRPAVARDGYPPEVRRRVIDAAATAVGGGHTVASVASALGVAASTLNRWLGEQAAAPTLFRPVRVQGSSAASPPQPLTLTSPGGWRVEGLDLDSLATLLARLA